MVDLTNTRSHEIRTLSLPQRLVQSRRAAAVSDRIDATDLRILAALQKDGRISKTLLANTVGLSLSACLDRMRRLRAKRFILSFHAMVNMRALCNLETFFAEVTLRKHGMQEFNSFEAYVKKIDEIVECYSVNGGVNYLLKIVSPGVEHFRSVADRLLESPIGIERFVTYTMTKAVKYAPQLSVDALAEFPDEGHFRPDFQAKVRVHGKPRDFEA